MFTESVHTMSGAADYWEVIADGCEAHAAAVALGGRVTGQPGRFYLWDVESDDADDVWLALFDHGAVRMTRKFVVRGHK